MAGTVSPAALTDAWARVIFRLVKLIPPNSNPKTGMMVSETADDTI